MADIKLNDVLYVKLITFDVARAKILSIDASEAEQVPGCRLCLHRWMIYQSPCHGFGPQFQDRPILADGETKYHGEPVAAIAAESKDAAEEGARCW